MKDVHEAVNRTLEQRAEVDASKVIVTGSGYGAFIALHLNIKLVTLVVLMVAFYNQFFSTMKSTKPKLTLTNFSSAFYQRDQSMQIEMIVLYSFYSSADHGFQNLQWLTAIKVD